mgnify:CR=1 FL=1
MKPVLLIFFIAIGATAPTTLGQSIYQCPGPDGLSYYQTTPCPQGARAVSQDNGKEGGNQDAVPPSPVTSPTPPPAESSGLGEVATVPARGRLIYKCPRPDGLSYYQQTPCPQGARMTIQDNGKESGDQPRGLREGECEWLRDYGGEASEACANTAQEDPPAETSGLREGERRRLEAIRQREAAAVRRNYEQALQAERARVTQTQTSPTESYGRREEESAAVREIRQRQAENERRYQELVGQSRRVEHEYHHEHHHRDTRQPSRVEHESSHRQADTQRYQAQGVQSGSCTNSLGRGCIPR